jgi:hypothetical protein
MKIETEFDVHNLVKRKFDKNTTDTVQLLEVMAIKSDTCYAGTQIFYHCRSVVAHKNFKHEFSKTGDYEWSIGHGVNNDSDRLAWRQYREDELVDAPEDEMNLILNGGEEKEPDK